MDNTLPNKSHNWDLVIARWLYKLSLKHTDMNLKFSAHGFGPFSDTVKLYGDLSLDETLHTEMKSLEAMMRDKPKKFKYNGKTSPSGYVTNDGAPQELKYYFDLFRKELRDETLDNLLEDDD